jgi:glycosyltransferase involved in cell wall biosynthesis
VKVGVDARSLLAGRGVAQVTRRLLAALAEGFPGDEWHAFVPGREPVDPPHPSVVMHRHRFGGRVLFGAGTLTGRPRLESLLGGGIDVAWIPAPVPVAVRVPFVLTVHDLSFEERPHDYTLYERLWHRAARPATLAHVAKRLTAVSGVTADEMTTRWGVPRGRISVVAPGVDARPAPAAPLVDRPYFLFVGALEPRKAPQVLAEGFARAREAGLDADLVVVGDGRLRGTLEGRPAVRLLGPLPRDEIDALYAGALAVVMPSWIEGYGLPPLEAAAHGTPSIVSDLPVFRETLGDAAVRVPAGDAVALGEALVRVASDEALRAAVGGAARARVAPLTWERAAAGLHVALTGAAGA